MRFNFKKALLESVLWLKRLMILTGIYFYTAHAVAAALSTSSRLELFNIGERSYSIVNDKFIEDEVKTRVTYDKTISQGQGSRTNH